MRQEQTKNTGELLHNLMNESVRSPIKQSNKLEKTGTETVGGVACDVYSLTSGIDKSITALAAMLGEKGGQLAKQFEDAGGKATDWIDPSRQKLIAKKHVRMTMNGKTSDIDQWNITFFQQADIDPAEVAYDMNEYKLQ